MTRRDKDQGFQPCLKQGRSWKTVSSAIVRLAAEGLLGVGALEVEHGILREG